MDHGRAATVVISGGVVYVLLGMVAAAINEGIVSDFYEHRQLDASTGLFLVHASFHLSGFSNVGAAAMIGMTSLVARRSGFFHHDEPTRVSGEIVRFISEHPGKGSDGAAESAASE